MGASAAPLDVTPQTLLEQVDRQRNARDLPWDPSTGRLGNLRHVNIVAPDCTVRVVSGTENRVFAGRGSVRVSDSPRVPDREAGRGRTARNLTLTFVPGATNPALPRIGDASSPVCFTLQVATAHSFIVGGDRLSVLFDRVELPVVDLYLNPSYGLNVWFRDVRLGALAVNSNAAAKAGGTGQVEWLTLGSSQGTTALLFHEMNAGHVGVGSTTIDPRFSIRIGPKTEASYYQPAVAAGDVALRYPIWIDGPVAALKVPVGRVNPMPVTEAIREEARKLRDQVVTRAGPMPVLPASERTLPAVDEAMPVSPRQRVADAVQPFVPVGVRLGTVDLSKRGGALVGVSPDEGSVRQFVDKLGSSGEVTSARIALMRREAERVAFRIVITFACETPGDRSACPPGTGPYTAQQIEEVVKPLLGPHVALTALTLREDGYVHVKGRASDVEANAALERIDTQLPWLRASTSSVGNGNFNVQLRLLCKAPPRAEGICVPG